MTNVATTLVKQVHPSGALECRHCVGKGHALIVNTPKPSLVVSLTYGKSVDVTIDSRTHTRTNDTALAGWYMLECAPQREFVVTANEPVHVYVIVLGDADVKAV